MVICCLRDAGPQMAVTHARGERLCFLGCELPLTANSYVFSVDRCEPCDRKGINKNEILIIFDMSRGSHKPGFYYLWVQGGESLLAFI